MFIEIFELPLLGATYVPNFFRFLEYPRDILEIFATDLLPHLAETTSTLNWKFIKEGDLSAMIRFLSHFITWTLLGKVTVQPNPRF